MGDCRFTPNLAYLRSRCYTCGQLSAVPFGTPEKPFEYICIHTHVCVCISICLHTRRQTEASICRIGMREPQATIPEAEVPVQEPCVFPRSAPHNSQSICPIAILVVQYLSPAGENEGTVKEPLVGIPLGPEGIAKNELLGHFCASLLSTSRVSIHHKSILSVLVRYIPETSHIQEPSGKRKANITKHIARNTSSTQADMEPAF